MKKNAEKFKFCWKQYRKTWTNLNYNIINYFNSLINKAGFSKYSLQEMENLATVPPSKILWSAPKDIGKISLTSWVFVFSIYFIFLITFPKATMQVCPGRFIGFAKYPEIDPIFVNATVPPSKYWLVIFPWSEILAIYFTSSSISFMDFYCTFFILGAASPFLESTAIEMLWFLCIRN